MIGDAATGQTYLTECLPKDRTLRVSMISLHGIKNLMKELDGIDTIVVSDAELGGTYSSKMELAEAIKMLAGIGKRVCIECSPKEYVWLESFIGYVDTLDRVGER